MARQTRFELPVLVLANAVSRARNSSRTRVSLVTSAAASAASFRQASVREDQRADLVAIGSGDDDVARIGSSCASRRARSGRHSPSAGGQLELLGDAAVEQEPGARIAGVFEFERIAELVEAVFVEGLRREVALTPMPGMMLGPRSRASSLPSLGTSLSSTPGTGTPILVESLLCTSRDRHGRAFSRAESGQKHDALPAGRERELLHFIEYRLRQRRAGEPQHFELPENVCRSAASARK